MINAKLAWLVRVCSAYFVTYVFHDTCFMMLHDKCQGGTAGAFILACVFAIFCGLCAHVVHVQTVITAAD